METKKILRVPNDLSKVSEEFDNTDFFLKLYSLMQTPPVLIINMRQAPSEVFDRSII